MRHNLSVLCERFNRWVLTTLAAELLLFDTLQRIYPACLGIEISPIKARVFIRAWIDMSRWTPVGQQFVLLRVYGKR